jgi:hypothetical protein
MSDTENKDLNLINQSAEELKPKTPSKLAAQGIRTFTVCRQEDETGVTGEGIVIQ